MNFYRKTILDSIDLSGYITPVPKVNGGRKGIRIELYNIFMAEMGWNVARVGQKQAAQDWIQGLCSACSVPFENYIILENATKAGMIPETRSEEEEDEFISMYWHYLSAELNDILNRAATLKRAYANL